ncbi:Zinc finger, RING/FYVE/PHD-type [Corchorus olitorius]|uniref:Zinc finger, RING/FYVE/PHD-type n=1 Tax=Corchorus olitorius TaxID=93759 RepID=A0A1R3KY02_9ROSI|nr:Zinc finger, RING/FYVE/PHD-type [Corchorus olitorius]
MAQEENFGHDHPLILLNGDEQSNNEIEIEGSCFRCQEKVLLSNRHYSCVQCSGFYLHKVCAEAPLQIINHPFHLGHHPLVLRQNHPLISICGFCSQMAVNMRFGYHCSCGLDLHFACALFAYYIAQSNLKELEGVELQEYPFTKYSIEIAPEQVRIMFPMSMLVNKKSDDLVPLKINHVCHRRHPLLLQFPTLESPSCKVCQNSMSSNEFAYCCLHCEFALHIECVSPSPSPIIEHKSHQHPFTLFWRRAPFMCDACGFEGNLVAYVCCTCNIIVHEKCTSLPRRIKSRWHDDHCLSHTYFLEDENFKNDRDCICIVCLDQVNTDLGSYSCSHYQIIAHANCATKDDKWYSAVEEENEDDDKSSDILALSPITVIETNDAGEATKIKHFKHIHNLMLECDFFLHKVCAELSKKKRVWLHECKDLLTLVSGLFYWQCHGCGEDVRHWAYYCKKCKYAVGPECLTLPTRAQHKCDEKHFLALTYHDENDYSATHYCDICEERRDPSLWFYRCATCDTFAHVKCVLGQYPFIKVGSIVKFDDGTAGTFVKEIYYYPKCVDCGKPCQDLAVELGEPSCSSIAHFKCRTGHNLVL